MIQAKLAVTLTLGVPSVVALSWAAIDMTIASHVNGPSREAYLAFVLDP